MAVPRSVVNTRAMRHRHGYTLTELVVVLAVLAVLLGIAMPPVGRWRDRTAVRTARDELAAALAWTRMAAAASGGAALAVDPETGRIWIRTAGGSEWRDSPPINLRARYGVRFDPGAGAVIRLPYDALGIGRFASRTFTLRRGAAVAGVTVSAYGRYRRW